MRKFAVFTVILAMALSMALPCFALFQPTYINDDFTVLWSETGDDGQTLIMSGKKSGVCKLTIGKDEDFIIGVPDIDAEADPSTYNHAKEPYEKLLKGERIPAGTVLQIKYSTMDASWPAGLGDVKEVDFAYYGTDMTVDEVQAVFDELNELGNTDKYKFVNSEDVNFNVRSLFTILSSTYDSENDRYLLMISERSCAYSAYSEQYMWYYYTGDITLNDKLAASDGSKEGDRLLELYKDKKHIPSGTVVEVLWSGFVSEIYPPVFEGITKVTFTDKKTEYSLNDAVSQVEEIKEFFSLPWDVPDEDDAPRFREPKEFTVIKYEPNSENPVSSKEHPSPCGTLYIAAKSGENGENLEYYQCDVDASEVAIICDTGDDEYADKARTVYNDFLIEDLLPAGTVVKVSYSGLSVCDSDPALLDGLTEIKITGRINEDFSKNELNTFEDGKINAEEPSESSDIFTVILSDPHSMYLARKTDSGTDVVYLYTDFHGSKIKLACTSADIKPVAERFAETGELPVGTVLKISHSGEFLESRPAEFSKVYKITVTQRKSGFTESEISALVNELSAGARQQASTNGIGY